jgi:hypothetical protein
MPGGLVLQLPLNQYSLAVRGARRARWEALVRAALAAPAGIDRRTACAALGVARASVYRVQARREPPPRELAPRAPSPRALASAERAVIVETLTSERFV